MDRLVCGDVGFGKTEIALRAAFVAVHNGKQVALLVPTTLLAQVDSSVGGKTAVNHRLGKNMVGAFHQPKAVIADTESLATLPDREYRSGIAEVIKYGLIRDRNFFEWLEANLSGILARSPEIIDHAE